MTSGFHFFTDAVDVTPSTAASWVDVDVSSYIPENATGVILCIHNESGATAYADVRRKGGETDDYSNGKLSAAYQCIAIVGVDENRVFQAKISSTSVKIYLRGYTDHAITFLHERVDVTPTSANTWTVIEVGDYMPIYATGVIVKIVNTSTSAYAANVRAQNSTDNRQPLTPANSWKTAFVGISTHRFQALVGNTAVKVYVIGFIKKPVYFFLNGISKAMSTTGAWTDMDLSSDIPSNAEGVLAEIYNGGSLPYPYVELRKNGSSDNFTSASRIPYGHIFHLVGCDSSQIIEYYISGTTATLYLLGYVVPDVEEWNHWYPKPDGTYKEFPTVYPTGTDHYVAVDDVASSPDDAASYIATSSSDTTAVKDSFKLTDYNTRKNDKLKGAKISKIILHIRAKKQYEANNTIKPFLYIGGNIYYGTETVISTAWSNYSFEWEKNPATNKDWTIEDIWNMEIGVESASAPYEALDSITYITQIYLEICYYFPKVGMFKDPVNITPVGYLGSPSPSSQYLPLDVEAYVPDDAKFAILEIKHTTNTQTDSANFRKNWNSDDDYPNSTFRQYGRMTVIIPLDKSLCMERKYTSYFEFHLLGYAKSSIKEVSPRIDISPEADNQWHDVDLSSYVSQNATGIIIKAVRGTMSVETRINVRKKGSTIEFGYNWNTIFPNSYRYIYVGLDANKVVQLKRSSTEVTFYLVGYFEEGWNFFTTNEMSNINVSTLQVWEDKDLTSYTSEEATVALFWLQAEIDEISFGVRRKGSSWTLEGSTYAFPCELCLMDEDQTIQIKKYSYYDPNIWLAGYYQPIDEPPFSISESISLSDAISRDKTVLISDELNISEVLLKGRILGILESLGLTEEISTPNRQLKLDDATSLSDIVLRNKLLQLLDVLSLTETILRNKVFTTLEQVNLVDFILANEQLSLTDVVSLIDTVLKDKTFQIIDLLGLTDVIFRSKTFAITDLINLAETISRDKSIQLLDSLGLIDATLRNKMLSITDQSSLVDTILRNKLFSVGEQVNLADVLLTGKQLKLTDTVLLIETIFRSKSFSILESINLFDIILRNKIFTLQDQSTLSEKIATDKQLLVSESLSLSDLCLTLKLLLLTDAINVQEAVGLFLGILKSVEDSISLSESIASNKIFTIADSASLVETVLRSKAFEIVDTATLIDSIKTLRNLLLTDSISLSEFIQIISGIIKYVEDSLNLTDQLKIDKALLVQETVSTLERLFRDKTFSIEDVLLIVESVLASKILKEVDSISLYDLSTISRLLLIEDLISLEETVEKVVAGILQLVEDSIHISDFIKLDKSLLLQEVIQILEEIKKVQAILRVQDIVEAVDLVVLSKLFSVIDSVQITEEVRILILKYYEELLTKIIRIVPEEKLSKIIPVSTLRKKIKQRSV